MFDDKHCKNAVRNIHCFDVLPHPHGPFRQPWLGRPLRPTGTLSMPVHAVNDVEDGFQMHQSVPKPTRVRKFGLHSISIDLCF